MFYYGETFVMIRIKYSAPPVLMAALARPYFAKVKTACEVRPSGVPRHSDEELTEILTSSRAHAISLVGAVGLLAILYLMVFKPGL